jgi:ElaB/YqjD/DUF883 family membrane-anchored ribosome-binding protein
MTAKERSKRIDDLKAEVTAGRGGTPAKSPADRGSGHTLGERAKEEIAEAVHRLTAEKDKLESELSALESRLSETIGKERVELEREIREHPIPSVLIAFAIGFVAASIFRH